MSIPIKCPCGAVHEMPDSWAGKKGKCPDCGRLLRVPRSRPGPADEQKTQKRQPEKPAAGEKPKPLSDEEFVPFEMKGADEETFDDGQVKKKKEIPSEVKAEGGFISFKCTCGKALKAPLAKVGKSAGCPQCKKPVTVPAPPGEKGARAVEPVFDYMSEEALETLHCANCGADLAKGAIICVQCGTNKISGEQIITKVGDDAFADEQKGLKNVLGKVAFWKKKK